MPKTYLNVKPFQPVNNAKPPKRMTEGAVGFDFYAEEIIRETPTSIWYRTGYGVDLPEYFFGDLRARSSVSETGLLLANGAGVVDPDYQGEVQFRFYKNEKDVRMYGHDKKLADYTLDQNSGGYKRNADIYQPGDRIGQMIVLPEYTRQYSGVQVVEDFEEETERGEGGFGHTGR